MHTVELLEEALRSARAQGYRIRYEWLESGTDWCEVRGQKWIFVDLAEDRVSQYQAVRSILQPAPPDAISSVHPRVA